MADENKFTFETITKESTEQITTFLKKFVDPEDAKMLTLEFIRIIESKPALCDIVYVKGKEIYVNLKMRYGEFIITTIDLS